MFLIVDEFLRKSILTEELDEITYLDQIYIKVNQEHIISATITKSNNKLLPNYLLYNLLIKDSDDVYLPLKKGDEYYLTFLLPNNLKTIEKIEFISEGYYVEFFNK